MNCTLPGYDSWLSPPDPRGASGDSVIYVERPVPDSSDPEATVELEVSVSFDSGSLYSATLPDGSDITLTRVEIENAEVDYSDEMQAREESAREDAYDRSQDR